MLPRHQDVPRSYTGPFVRWSGVAVLLTCALAASGCATMISGTSQRILVSTYPSGAQCSLVNRSAEAPVIVTPTPAEAEVRRSGGALEVRCAKDGHLDATGSYESFAAANMPATRRQVVAANSLLHDFGSLEVAHSQAVKEAETQAMVGTGVGTVVAMALPTTIVATAGPTMGGGAAVAGAGLVAAPLLLGLIVAAPISLVVDLSSGAAFKYPAAVMLILPPSTFNDESSRDAYYAEVDRQFELARDALRADSASRCFMFGCDTMAREDDAFIADWRSRVAATRSRTTIAASDPPFPPTPMEPQ